MEIKSTEKEENMENNNIEIENEQLGKNDSNSIDSISKNKNIFSSNLRGSEETHFSSDNKSISAEKPDKREDPIQYIHSTIINNNTKNNSKISKLKGLKKSSPIKEKKIPHQFHIFLERTEDFQKKKTENINQLHQNYEESIKKIMQNTPQLTKKSRLIDKRNSKPKFLDRIKDEQIKQKQRKEKLIEKINLEKLKKKEEIEKPLKFHIKQKEDKKFMKVYKIMMKREKENLKDELIIKEKQNTINENKIIELRQFIKQISDDKNLNESKQIKEIQKLKNKSIIFKDIKEGDKCMFVPYSEKVYVCINLTVDLNAINNDFFRCNIILDFSGFDEDKKKLIIENNLILIATISELKEVIIKEGEINPFEVNEINNEENEEDDFNEVSTSINSYLKATNCYHLAKISNIDYIIGFPEDKLCFMNYNNYNTNFITIHLLLWHIIH